MIKRQFLGFTASHKLIRNSQRVLKISHSKAQRIYPYLIIKKKVQMRAILNKSLNAKNYHQELTTYLLFCSIMMMITNQCIQINLSERIYSDRKKTHFWKNLRDLTLNQRQTLYFSKLRNMHITFKVTNWTSTQSRLNLPTQLMSKYNKIQFTQGSQLQLEPRKVALTRAP